MRVFRTTIVRCMMLLSLSSVFSNAEIPCELYDVTTLVRLTGDSANNFEIHSRTNAVGLPLDLTNEPRLKVPDSTFSCEFNGTELCSGWTSTAFAPCPRIPEDRFSDDGDRSIILQTGRSGQLVSPEFIPQHQQLEMCVSLRYSLDIHKSVALTVYYEHATSEKMALEPQTLKGVGEVVSKHFSFVKPRELQSKDVKMKLKFKFDLIEPQGHFVLRAVRDCSAKDRDVFLISQRQFPKPQKEPPRRPFIDFDWESYRRRRPQLPELGYGLRCQETNTTFSEHNGFQNKKCENGGREINGWCQCFPGFIGQTCERECPPNRFGADCGGICNPFGSEKCKGIQFAAPGMKLRCARGYYGTKCDQECVFGWYGQGCDLRCGHCGDDTCDRFSGTCNTCAQGYVGPKCDKEVESANLPVIISTGFNFIEGRLNTSLDTKSLKSYPYAEIIYAELGEREKSKLIPLKSKEQIFRISNLRPGRQYYLYSLLIHETGTFLNNTELRVIKNVAKTDCNACTTISDIDAKPTDDSLTVEWKVTETCSHPCPRTGFELEINSIELEKAIVEKVGAEDTQKKLDMVLPKEGIVRLRPTYITKEGMWSEYVQFRYNYVLPTRSTLQMVGKTAHSIDLVWTGSRGPKNDNVICMVEPLLCHMDITFNDVISAEDLITKNTVRLVSGGNFTIENLRPFARYNCSLQNERLAFSTTTNPALPSGKPNQHKNKPTEVTPLTGTIHWRDADCWDVNGIPEGFVVQLYRGGVLETPEIIVSSEDRDSWSYKFLDLHPATTYEARIFVRNHIGYNTSNYLTVPFETST